MLLTQLLCYINQYYVVVILLGPLPFILILFLTFANTMALMALYASNSTHLRTAPNTEGSMYCKTCCQWISYRDHHCIFTGRCVEKNNYSYFISYLIYSYILSSAMVASILSQYPLLFNIFHLSIHVLLYSSSMPSPLLSG
jgi:hypothetical protein